MPRELSTPATALNRKMLQLMYPETGLLRTRRSVSLARLAWVSACASAKPLLAKERAKAAGRQKKITRWHQPAKGVRYHRDLRASRARRSDESVLRRKNTEGSQACAARQVGTKAMRSALLRICPE